MIGLKVDLFSPSAAGLRTRFGFSARRSTTSAFGAGFATGASSATAFAFSFFSAAFAATAAAALAAGVALDAAGAFSSLLFFAVDFVVVLVGIKLCRSHGAYSAEAMAVLAAV